MIVLFIGNDQSIITGVNGDARERMREYAKHFNKLFIVIFSLRKDNLPKILENNLEIYPTNSLNRWFFILDSLKIIRHLRVDLISTQDPFIAGLAGVLAKLFFKIKLNIQIHNDFFGSRYFRFENLQNHIFYWLGKFNLLFADSVRVVSPRQKIGKNCFVAPVAADLDFFWAPPHTKKFKQIVCVARLVKQKNLKMLTDIADKLSLNLKIVGEGPERKNLPEKYLVGQKSPREIREIFKKSDVFVLPSNYEGWGLVCLEALAAGLPVIMTDTGCTGEVIINNVTGKIIPVGDQKSLLNAVQDMKNDPAKTAQMVMAGQKLLKEKYLQDQLAKQFINGLKNT